MALAVASAVDCYSQNAFDAMSISRPELKGTARYMSMGGAFGALGGDLTTLSMNPGGIGVYRNHEVGLTMALDALSTNSESPAGSFSSSSTPFFLNNIGGVLTLKLNSDILPNLNFGFTYNRTASFHNRYGGNLGNLKTSMSDMIAGIANTDNIHYADLEYSNNPPYNPYNPTDGGYEAPWITILGYQSYLITPYEDENQNVDWYGQFGENTSGTASYYVEEKGGIDSFNIAIGGNISNYVYWGMDFDISDLNFTRSTSYAENLQNAYVETKDGVTQTSSQWNLTNWYNITGTGFTYKLGVIVRPIQEFRIGVAFHTPTWYALTQTSSGSINARYGGDMGEVTNYTNSNSNGYWTPYYNNMRFVSPWRLILSAAGVIGNKFIVSADYQLDFTSKMHWKDPDNYYYDYGYGFPEDNNSYYEINNLIKKYYNDTHTLRVGAEYRVTKNLSLRVGYSNVTSGVNKNNTQPNSPIETLTLCSTNPAYTLSNSTNYYTAGIGWRQGGFYGDFAYVNKQNSFTYHAFPGDPYQPLPIEPTAKVKYTNNQFVLSLGYKF